MALNTKSIRTKMLGLLAGIALAVAVASVVYDLFAGEAVIHDQIVKRGRYVASNLAFNAKYGVLTEDKPLLTQFLEGAVNAGGTGETSDVVGAMIRDAKGETLAQVGKAIRDLPKDPAAKLEERDATTADGDTVLLFRAPVTTSGSGGGLGEERRAAGEQLVAPVGEIDRRQQHDRDPVFAAFYDHRRERAGGPRDHEVRRTQQEITAPCLGEGAVR